MCHAAAAFCAKGMERQPLLTAAAARVPVDRRANAAVRGGNAGCSQTTGVPWHASWRCRGEKPSTSDRGSTGKTTRVHEDQRIFLIEPRENSSIRGLSGHSGDNSCIYLKAAGLEWSRSSGKTNDDVCAIRKRLAWHWAAGREVIGRRGRARFDLRCCPTPEVWRLLYGPRHHPWPGVARHPRSCVPCMALATTPGRALPDTRGLASHVWPSPPPLAGRCPTLLLWSRAAPQTQRKDCRGPARRDAP